MSKHSFLDRVYRQAVTFHLLIARLAIQMIMLTTVAVVAIMAAFYCTAFTVSFTGTLTWIAIIPEVVVVALLYLKLHWLWLQTERLATKIF